MFVSCRDIDKKTIKVEKKTDLFSNVYLDTLNFTFEEKKYYISYCLDKIFREQDDISGRRYSRTFYDGVNTVSIAITDYKPFEIDSNLINGERWYMNAIYLNPILISQKTKTFQNNLDGLVSHYDCDTIFVHSFRGMNTKYNLPFLIENHSSVNNEKLIEIIESIDFEEIK
jgi:hypothetical protein